MPDSELEELIRLYAIRGVRDWNGADDTVCSGVRSCLSASGIVDKEQLVRRELERSRQSDVNAAPRFFPMPDTYRKGKKKSTDRPEVSLFTPRFPAGKQSHVAFDLISYVSFMDRRHCLVFRLEPADNIPLSSHGYPHVQLCRSLSGGAGPVDCVPQWLPHSYPAFPVPARNSVEMFLSMAVAVHGLGSGMKQLIEEMFQGRPLDVQRYARKLRDLFEVGEPIPESSKETSDNNEHNRP